MAEEQQEKKMKVVNEDDDNFTFTLSSKYLIPYERHPGHQFVSSGPREVSTGFPFPAGALPVSKYCVISPDRNSLTVTLQHGAFGAVGANGTYEDALLTILRDLLLYQEQQECRERILTLLMMMQNSLQKMDYKFDCSVLVPYESFGLRFIPYDPKDPRGMPFPPGRLPYSEYAVVSEDRNSFTLQLKSETTPGADIEVLASIVRDLLLFKNQRGSPLCCREFSGAITNVEELLSCLIDIRLCTFLSADGFTQQLQNAIRLATEALHWLCRRSADLQAKGKHGTPK